MMSVEMCDVCDDVIEWSDNGDGTGTREATPAEGGGLVCGRCNRLAEDDAA